MVSRGFPGFPGVHNPPLKMAVIGAVHIAQAPVRLAGHDVTVIAPRGAFAPAQSDIEQHDIGIDEG